MANSRPVPFVHCACHNLNLVINGAVQAVVGYVDFFDTLQEIFVFFGCSLNRWAELAFTAEHAESLKLKKLTPTRWASRIYSVRAVKNRYTDIMKVLSRISLESTNSKESSGASGLRKRMGTYEFIVSVVVWERVLVAINKASVELQPLRWICHVLKFCCPWHWLS